jgi:hypothetical protein
MQVNVKGKKQDLTPIYSPYHRVRLEALARPS